MDTPDITRQLTIFEELVKHLATKEELLLLKIDIQKLRVELILWIIGTNVAIGGAVVGVMLYLNNQLTSQFNSQFTLLQHFLKP